jgi:hypothetical protein
LIQFQYKSHPSIFPIKITYPVSTYPELCIPGQSPTRNCSIPGKYPTRNNACPAKYKSKNKPTATIHPVLIQFQTKIIHFSNERNIPGKQNTRNSVYPEQCVPGKAHTQNSAYPEKYRSKNSPTAMILPQL